MHRNKSLYVLFLILLGVQFGSNANAQSDATITPSAPSSAPNTAPNAAAKNKTKKKIKIDFENETITGNYDVPDTLFLNSRRLIKYKELFNKRTNFIEEIESNKGLFNEHQK